jgi:hypothetical protein
LGLDGGAGFPYYSPRLQRKFYSTVSQVNQLSTVVAFDKVTPVTNALRHRHGRVESSFIKVVEFGVLQPIHASGVKHYSNMYADDVMLLPAPSGGEARAIARMLSIFGGASGLHTNFDKCLITPIFGG